MGQRGLGIGEGQSCLQRRQRHARTQRHILQIVEKLGQRGHDFTRRCDCECVGDRIGIHIPDRFERMRQRVESALHGDRSRQRQHQVRIHERGFRPGLGQV